MGEFKFVVGIMEWSGLYMIRLIVIQLGRTELRCVWTNDGVRIHGCPLHINCDDSITSWRNSRSSRHG